MRTYQQLSQDERYQIQVLLRLRKSPGEIAKTIGRAPSTIYREIARNSDPTYPCELTLRMPPPASTKYNAGRAQGRAAKRRIAKGAAQRKIQGELQAMIEAKLRLGWSPEQIANRMRVELGISITAETIYQHIIRDSQRLGFYRYCLRFAGYKHKRFKKSKQAERTRRRKHWIDDRPTAANERTELGHWERDCLLGKRGGSALLTLVDRKSRYVKVRRVSKVDTQAVAAATVDALRGMPVASLTNDNGIEFQRDESLQSRLDTAIYFCNPGSPWERGSIENTNGLFRQYCPSSCDFDTMAPWGPSALEDTLNFRPRKVLGYRTPHEAFYGVTLNLMDNPAMHFGLEFSVHK